MPAITCKNCHKKFSAPDTALGKTAKCPSCDNLIHVQTESAQVEQLLNRQSISAPRSNASSPSKSRIIKASVIFLGALILAFAVATVREQRQKQARWRQWEKHFNSYMEAQNKGWEQQKNHQSELMEQFVRHDDPENHFYRSIDLTRQKKDRSGNK